MERLNLIGRFAGSRRLDMMSYRRLMSKPTRHYFLHAIVATRAHTEGRDGVVQLLRFTEAHHRELNQEEHRTDLVFLYYSLLTILDKMDRWEEYLRVTVLLRERTRVVAISAAEPRSIETLDSVFEEVLWWTQHRTELIERKLHRKQAGKKLGNLMHARQEDLSDEEIQKRLARILRWSRSGEIWISLCP